MNQSPIAEPVMICAQCGSHLSSSDGTEKVCINCLLHAALDGEDADHPARPHRFDQYELIAGEDGAPVELGRGAMGITYKAFDTNLRCEVALKVIHPHYLADESSRARFLSEARCCTTTPSQYRIGFSPRERAGRILLRDGAGRGRDH